MKVIFQVAIVPSGGGGQTMRKVVDLPFVPLVGMEIETSAWKSGRKVVAVSIDIDESLCAVAFMGMDKVSNDKQFEQQVEMYKAHGWKDHTQKD